MHGTILILLYNYISNELVTVLQGEKSYEVYEVPKSDPSRAANHLPWKKSSKFSDKDSLSTTSGKSNSKITSKISHIVRRLSLHITSVPALLARLPDGILPYISPSTQLLQSWDASHSFWLQCSVTIRLCRHFLDLRASAQRRALYFLRLMSSQNHSGEVISLNYSGIGWTNPLALFRRP